MDDRAVALALAALLVLSGCTAFAPPVSQGEAPGDRIGGIESPDDFADPEEDQLGWEGGYWYDEPIDADPEAGLSEAEQAAIINRTMARVEYIRGLEFEEPVTVEVMSREEFREQQLNRSVSDARRQQLNVTYEALFMIDGETDAATVRQQNTASSVAGYYSPTENRIVVIGDGPESLLLNERTLAHELLHALQDQHFDLTRYDRSTHERNNAVNGLIEGDARFVEYHYMEYCDGEWECFDQGGVAVGGEIANIGPQLISYQPYSDGPSFIDYHYQRGGWSSINRMYADPPASSGQVIYSDRYPHEQPVHPRVTDRTRGSWERIEVENRPNYEELGTAGATGMFVYPGYESNGRTQIIPLEEFVNPRESGAVQFDPLNYENSYTSGLRGDRLVPYQNDAGETGYVWALTFEDAESAAEFRRGYGQLLDYRNARTVEADGPGTTYRIDDGDPNSFGAAFRVVQDGDRIVITSAPMVAQLEEVRQPTARATHSAGEPTAPIAG